MVTPLEVRAEATVRQTIDEHLRVIRALDPLVPTIEEAAARMIACLESGGKVCWMGNGGSAGDSQHLAAELVGRFTRERRGLASIALTTDTSILTAIGNDYGYDAIFARQVEALCRPGDLVVGITTSGNSQNVLAALRRAAEIGAYRIGMTGGKGGALAQECDLLLAVPAPVTARVQEAHLLIGHILCDLVEAHFATPRESH
jgi:D-sedoheptulose 7-phosphate isomerase